MLSICFYILRQLDSDLQTCCPVYLAAFNVRTLKQAGQQAALALTLDSLGVDVCCVSETRIQDSSVITELTAPSVSSHWRYRYLGLHDFKFTLGPLPHPLFLFFQP